MGGEEECSVCRCLKIPGMCFDPSDEQLVACYLKDKIEGKPLRCNHVMTELQIYHDDMMPWEIIKDDNPYWISDSSNMNKIKKTIYVFTELRRKTTRVIRRSGCGSWTLQNNPVVKNKAGEDIGYNKLLTFYKDSDDKKKKKKKILDDDQEHGHWIMHEYSLFGTDNYVLCKIIKEVRVSEKVSVLCTTKAEATQDFRTQGDARVMNIVSEDQERQLGYGVHSLDESIADWDKNGWMDELYQEFGMDISDDQNQIAITDGTRDGVGVSQELPVTGVIMENCQKGQVIQEISMQEISVAIREKNDESDKGLDGASIQNNIIIDDDSTGVYDGQELVMIEAAYVPQIQAINVDDQGDDFWEELDVVLDFSSADLMDLWPDEFNQQSCSIIERQPGKRMRCGEEDREECPNGKKQRCL